MGLAAVNEKLPDLDVDLAALKNLSEGYQQTIVAIDSWVIAGLLPNPRESLVVGVKMLLAFFCDAAGNAMMLPPRLKWSGVLCAETAIPAFRPWP